jgi:hypothetical protein
MGNGIDGWWEPELPVWDSFIAYWRIVLGLYDWKSYMLEEEKAGNRR